MSIVIREKDSGTLLARGEIGAEVVKYEGNLYFTPESVEHGVLKVTERTYSCPVKGLANWIDYVGPDGKSVRNVAWVYPQPRAGHELIASRYGFYSGHRGATRQDEA